MSDTESDDDTLCRFGTALTPYEKNEIPSKKPINLEDQIAKDDNGRRRFHGAFTGGFSAGFWNTVGSQEGFTPNTFKSSRTEKGYMHISKPTDYMDDEDRGEFGIAPQRIQAKTDFDGSSSHKRKLDRPSNGPIPGIPVLHDLLKPVHDKIAVRILKKMGWRDGQGVGARLTSKEKKRAIERNQKEIYLLKNYGCDMGPFSSKSKALIINAESEEDDSDGEIMFAPDDFDPYVASIKENSFGLGYTGLISSSRGSTSTKHIHLFQMVDRNNKKISIAGQAFGVGALEEEDEDIYAPEDLTKYDRSLDNKKNKQRILKPKPLLDTAIVEGFAKTTISNVQVKVFSVDLPRNFRPRDWATRRSRFAPIDINNAKKIEENNKYKVLGIGRHDLKPEDRGALLNDKLEPGKINNELEMKKRRTEREKEANERRLEAAKKLTEKLMSKQFVSESNENFRPFISDAEKQERYDKFIEFKGTDENSIKEFFRIIQPLSMSQFEMEMEMKEFEQAKKMYKPLDAFMSNRFVTEFDLVKEKQQSNKINSGNKKNIIQRTKSMWKPHKDVCKRFNIPEPYGGMMFDEEAEKKKQKQKSSLFDYIGVPINTKSNFSSPKLIPRKIFSDDDLKRKENFKKLEQERQRSKPPDTNAVKITAKDFFNDVPSTSKSTMNLKLPIFESTDSDEKRFPPKVPIESRTELEIQVIESMHKKINEKKDLFRAIFCDSESEDESVKINEDTIEKADQKEKFIDNFLNLKPASEINVLRNTSPPRGLFKNFLVEAIASTNEDKKIIIENINELYGPRLPEKMPVSLAGPSTPTDMLSDLDGKIQKKLNKKKSKVTEKWVEKEALIQKNRKHDKHKKHKKEKKVKKHKSRH